MFFPCEMKRNRNDALCSKSAFCGAETYILTTKTMIKLQYICFWELIKSYITRPRVPIHHFFPGVILGKIIQKMSTCILWCDDFYDTNFKEIYII